LAETVQIGATGHTAKIRHPVAVPALSIITLGIYYIYWWYQVNRELAASRRTGRSTAALGASSGPKR
jgi:hypothetical protein